jgi:hypothetical protein
MDVSTWLRDLGLENYVQAFQAHHIDAEVLPRLTVDDLIALGITSVATGASCSSPSPCSRAAMRRHRQSRPQCRYAQPNAAN